MDILWLRPPRSGVIQQELTAEDFRKNVQCKAAPRLRSGQALSRRTPKHTSSFGSCGRDVQSLCLFPFCRSDGVFSGGPTARYSLADTRRRYYKQYTPTGNETQVPILGLLKHVD